MVCVTLGMTDVQATQLKATLREQGRAFDTPAEVNAFAAAHDWPNWKPLATD